MLTALYNLVRSLFGKADKIKPAGDERFAEALKFTLAWEIVRDKKGNVIAETVKDDPGGTTKYGIDQRSHPGVDIRNLTESGATAIYKKDYWDKNACATLPWPLALVHFDSAVNTGNGQAALFLSRSNGDAKIYCDEREKFYNRLVVQKSSNQKFITGWLNRLNALRKKAELAFA